ncbi:MAG: glycosyltransferase family 4 protein [Candidatus Kerfeldbacteria bacterium]|nr:glycosyltransferase family 4 protein [Candidatus Kerfeldbacteria bacterium]
MVIGIDASRANLAHKTGTEWYSFFVIQELKKIIPTEHRIIVYSRDPLQGELAQLPSHWSSVVLNWPPRVLWTQLRLSAELLVHRIDVLYVSAHTLPLIGGKKNVAVIHDVGFFRNTALYSKLELAYHRLAFFLALKKSNTIITISQFSASEITALSPTSATAKKLSVIHNGFVRRTVPVNAQQRVEQLNLTRPYILTLGRVEEKKNMLRCVESFARVLQDTQWGGDLVCVGAFGYGAERIRTRAQELGILGRVHFLEWQDEETVAALLSCADMFYFPTLYEGFGMPVIEALDMGIPVVCSDIPPLKEIAQDAAVFFDPFDVTAMSHAVSSVISERVDARNERIARGKKVAQRFSWRETAEKTWSLIERT